MTAEAAHPRHEVDEHLNSPVRLSIVATLAKVDDAEFQVVRDAIELSDSVLSKQVSLLEAVGYVKVRKGYVGKRPRTWLSATELGRNALGKHIAALRAITAGIDA
jgi:DNA-binding MarR family transcriptional regulator